MNDFQSRRNAGIGFRRNAGIGFIFITILLDIVGLGIIIPVAPRLVSEVTGLNLQASAPYVGGLAALYAAMQFIFAPVLGNLSDKYGRRPVILAALFGMGLDYFFLSFARTLPLLLIGRIISGIMGGSITPATAYIADVSAPEKRAQNFGFVGMAFGVGFILGPLIGALVSSLGIRAPFIAAGTLSIINWLYGYFVLPESLAQKDRRNFELSKANPFGALANLSKYPSVLGLLAAIVLATLAQGALENIWVLYTGTRYGWGPRETGFSLAAVGLSAAIVQGGLARVLLPKLGEYRAIVLGLSCSVLSFVGYGLATKGWMVIIILVLGSLAGLAGPSLQALMSRQVSATEQGLLSGSVASVSSLTRIFSPLIATALFSFFANPNAKLQILGAPFFFGALCFAFSLILAMRSMKTRL